MPAANSTIAIDTLARLTTDAYEGDPTHSLLANLRDLSDRDWTALPVGGGRSVAEILEHVGWSKWMYDNYAFGDALLRGDIPPIVPANAARSRPLDELLPWLDEGHRRWLASIRSLPNDMELERERLSTWGDRLSTRTLIRLLIAHDFYHAGEINHIRALLAGTDHWPYD